MTKIYPVSVSEREEVSTELEISPKKEKEMMAKAIELLGDEVMESGKLCELLENYYVFEKNEHYTSRQLKDIVFLAKKEIDLLKNK
jgi:hypothetical protein